MGSDSESEQVDATEWVGRILTEGPLGMSAAARLLGTFRDGKPTHPSTLVRWHHRGVTLPDGRTVRLEAVRINGRLVTSRAAVIRFVAAQQPIIADTTLGIEGPLLRRTKKKGGHPTEDELRDMGC